MNADISSDVRSLIIIPCLNEARHIEALIAKLGRAIDELDARIVVADGGSTDGTQDIVTRIANSDPRVLLIDNPKRLQSAALNLAVSELGFDSLMGLSTGSLSMTVDIGATFGSG